MNALLNRIPFGSRRIRILTLALGVLFILYTILGFFVAGPVARSIMEEQLTTLLKRKTVVKNVSVNPFTFRVQVDELNVAQKNGNGTFVGFSKLDIRPHPVSVFKLAPVLAHLRFEKPVVDISFFGKNTFSFSDLIPTPDDQVAKPEAPEQIIPFRIDNFQLSNGTITFHDTPREATHVVSELDINIPLTTSLDGDDSAAIEPSLQARINGEPIQLTGKTQPFHETLRTEFTFDIKQIDLPQYWKYVPVKLPVKLTSGSLTNDLTLGFQRPQGNLLEVTLSGETALNNVVLESDTDGKVLSFDSLGVSVASFSLLRNNIKLNAVTLQNPYVKIIRRKNGNINWLGYMPAQEQTNVPETQDNSTATPIGFDIAQIALRNGNIDFIDRTLAKPFSKKVTPINVALSGVSNLVEAPSPLMVSIGNEGSEHITAQGNVALSPVSASVTATAQHIALADYKHYLQAVQPLAVDSGIVNASVAVELMPDGNITAQNGTVTLSDLALRKPDNKSPSIKLGALSISGATVDVGAQRASVNNITIQSPYARVYRYANGIDLATMFEDHTAQNSSSTDNAPQQANATPSSAKPAKWQATVGNITLDDGRVDFKDRALKNRADITVSGMRASLRGVSTDLTKAIPYTFYTRVNRSGTVRLNGSVLPQPLTVATTTRIANLPLPMLDPYVAEFTGFLLAGGAMDTQMDTTVSIPSENAGEISYTAQGTLSVSDLLLKDSKDASVVAGFKKFNVDKLNVSSAESSLHIEEIALHNPVAAARIDTNGIMNFSRILTSADQDKKDIKAPATEEKANSVSETQSVDATGASSNSTQAQTKALVPFRTARINRIRIHNGTASFADASVSPIFATTLTDMNLRLDGASLEPEARPELDFTALLDGQELSLNGKVNPLIQPVYSDLKFSLNGMDLVPLTPYAIKHVAYPINRGRLYADLSFHTENWELKAQNKFFVEKLTLGDKDKRPDAPSVPIKLGLALLQDSNDNMEIDLPVAGRLDDPSFRLGGIIFKAFMNLIVKVVTSPFALIGNIVGGDAADAQFAVFDAGSATLSEGERSKLQSVAQFMKEKAKLSMTVAGYYDPASDPEGIVKRTVQRQVKTAKYESLSRKEKAVITIDAVEISPEEYPKYLEDAYEAVPETENDPRPKGVFGFKEQPVEVMEAFLKSQVSVTEADLKELAQQRAQAVQKSLIEIAPELAGRVSLTASKDKPASKPGVPIRRAELGVQ